MWQLAEHYSYYNFTITSALVCGLPTFALSKSHAFLLLQTPVMVGLAGNEVAPDTDLGMKQCMSTISRNKAACVKTERIKELKTNVAREVTAVSSTVSRAKAEWKSKIYLFTIVQNADFLRPSSFRPNVQQVAIMFGRSLCNKKTCGKR